MFTPTGRTWPLVGRVQELQRLAQTRTAGAGAVVVSGPAGVGKSRLAREALIEAERSGAVGLWVQATRSAAGVPLGAFAGVIPADVRSDDPFELMRGCASALRELAGGAELALAVDDAHLLDPVSAAVVLHLATSAAAFVLATVRRGEPCPDAVVSLWKDAAALRLELDTLTEEETGALVEAIVGAPVGQDARRRIWENSLGNALYVRELVLSALAGGAFSEVRGLWRLSIRPPVSASLTELIAARMAGLSGPERRALELLALGEPLRLGDVAALCGSDVLAAMEGRGLVRVDGPAPAARVHVAHPLYGEVIRASMPSLRARESRLSLAAAVQARGTLGPDDALRVARWLLDAGADIPTELLLDAARGASLSGDPDLAVELAERAAEAGAGLQAALLLARAHAAGGRHAQADSVLAAAESLIDNQEDALEYLEQRRGVLYWGLRQPQRVPELLARAERWWPDGSWRRRLEPIRLRVSELGSARGLGVIVSESSELLAADDLDPEARRQLEALRLLALFHDGRAREACELARRICPAPPLRDQVDEAAIATRIGVALETGEGLRELEAWARELLPSAVGLGDHAAAGLAALALGGARFLEGRLRDSRRWLAEAELQLEQRDAVGLRVVAAAIQAGVACAAREPATAVAALERCREILHGEDPLPGQAPYVACAEGWAALATGEHRRAQRLFLEGAAACTEKPVYASRLTYEAMLAGAPARRVAAQLTALAERCDARLMLAFGAHARASAAGDAPALLDVAAELEQVGARRFAAEAAAAAARIHLAEGRQDSARRAAARSRALLPVGQNCVPPPIEGLDDEAVSLTRREAQLVELAARGLSNRQIAEQLVLSVRTVESHLYHAMHKLGVGDRRELASLRPPPGTA